MTPMRIADGWLTLTQGATLSAAAVATDFFRNDLRDSFIVFLRFTTTRLMPIAGDSNRGRCGVNLVHCAKRNRSDVALRALRRLAGDVADPTKKWARGNHVAGLHHLQAL